ncbi:cell division protein FtsQ/DivIB [Alphaproteobacteria bacterium]|nr:cell division protein FtsQ/DivIB [Alphaproteobacteria bacterium]
MNKKYINKRKISLFKYNYYFVYLGSFFLLIFFLIYYNLSGIKSFYTFSLENFSTKYNYVLTDVEITGINYIKEEEILNFFQSYIGKSIFLLPLNEFSKEIRKNIWVKDLNIDNNFKNKLFISIEEEIPLGIYLNNKKRILISQNLVILNILNDEKKFIDLIVFKGENSIHNILNLLNNLNADIIDKIKLADYIENRRWNINLKNKIQLKLPENNIKEAINNYEKIYKNYSNSDLEKIFSIDLRITNRAIIEYKK